MRIVTGEEMREFDRITIEEMGIPGVILMEHAGLRAALEIAGNIKPPARILIIAGKGNNGGDGFVIHRWLAHWGYKCTTLLLTSGADIQGDAKINLEILHRINSEIIEIQDETMLREFWQQISQYSLIVDGIFGTGIKGEVLGLSRTAIELVNQTPCWVVAIDIPSGLDVVTGEPLGVAIEAQMTVTFGLPKLGLLLEPGRSYVGDLKVVDIGIPEEIIRKAGVQRFLMSKELCRPLLPKRPIDGHKGTFGRVIVLAGSEGLTGAAALTAEGALYSGAGLVTLGIPRSLNQIMEVKLTEVMTKPLAERDGQFAFEAIEEIKTMAKNANVVAFGPGVGRSGDLQKILQILLKEVQVPLVIDADGLNNLDSCLEFLRERTELTILTPHPGELARLLNLEISEIQRSRVEIAKDFAEKYGVILVLKGVPTVTAFPDGQIYLNSTGNHGMGTGGTGDVLTGIISGLLAQKPDAYSVVAGVFLHGLAGDLYAKQYNARSLIASDLFTGIPLAFNEISEE